MNVIRQVCASAILGVGFTLVIASANLDLSVGYMLGMIGVIMGLLSRANVPFVLVLLAGLATGALCGFINGFIGVKFKLPLFIVTLATGQVYRGACQLLSNTSPVNGLQNEFKVLGQGYLLGVPIPIYIMVVVGVTLYIVLNKTRFGRHAIATGGNREAARTSGINTDSVTIRIYMIMGVCAAIAAMVMTGRAFSAQPAAGQGMEMDAIAAVVIGGTSLSGGAGRIGGTVVGCLIVGVMHCHPVNLLAMTFVHSLDERDFTRTLWQMCSECIVVFPDGVSVLPWMLCGTNEIGEATAEKMKDSRLVVWSQHGIYGTGRDLDEAFGLIETAEKAAEIYMKIAHLPWLQTITDEGLHLLEQRFGVKAREGYLK